MSLPSRQGATIEQRNRFSSRREFIPLSPPVSRTEASQSSVLAVRSPVGFFDIVCSNCPHVEPSYLDDEMTGQ